MSIDRHSSPQEVQDFFEAASREERVAAAPKLRPNQIVEGLFVWFVNRKPEYAERLAGQSGVFRFEVEGERGGVWTITLADGRFSAAPGEPPRVDFGVIMHIDDVEDMQSGELDPAKAFMKGKVRTQGDMGAAMRIGMAMFGDKIKKYIR